MFVYLYYDVVKKQVKLIILLHHKRTNQINYVKMS